MMTQSEYDFAEAESSCIPKLFDLLPGVYYFVKNKELQVVKANQAFAKLCGYDSADEIIGLTDYDIVSRHLAARYEKDDRHILATGKSLVERTEPLSSGTDLVSMHITTKTAVRNRCGKIIGIVALTRGLSKTNCPSKPNEDMQVIIEKMEADLRCAIQTDELASLVNMSNSTLLRHFKEYFDTTPCKYLKKIRLNEVSKLLLKTRKPLVEINSAVGFCDQSYMAREFHEFFGLSPSQYRQKYS